MIQVFRKGIVNPVSESFDSTRFDCKCEDRKCTETLVDVRLVEALEELLSQFHKFDIHSGFRCAAHNEAVGGKPDSQHLLGKAVDISCMFATPDEIRSAAEKMPVFANGGIGFYPSFVHLDTRGKRARW